jgi:threonylcarbamoyladenosine tRNA methylthiotransferase MtaB
MSDTAPVSSPLTIHSFGCRLNIAESEGIRSALRGRNSPEPLVVINGCAVTEAAMTDTARAARRARRDQPDARVLVTGCAGQIDPARFAAMAEVDRVLGNGEKFEPSNYGFDAEPGAFDARRIIVGDAMALTRTAPQMVPAFAGHARGFLEVQNGCDHRCTFCVIPYGRGPSRSVPIGSAVQAAQALVAGGHRELVLTGVDLTSYGLDLPDEPKLANLIERLLRDVPGLLRLRLGSIDVAEIDDALFALLTGEMRMMPHVHLSLQHGDDLILKRMKRRHSRLQAVAMIDRLKAARPAIAIGADLIAGFPTEDDAAAARNASLIADAGIVFAHIFPYSVRTVTPAARMPQVDRTTVKARARLLRELGESHRRAWLAGQIGSHAAVLIERDGVSGHAANFAKVRMGCAMPPGQIADVLITGLDGDTLIGKEAA